MGFEILDFRMLVSWLVECCLSERCSSEARKSANGFDFFRLVVPLEEDGRKGLDDGRSLRLGAVLARIGTSTGGRLDFVLGSVAAENFAEEDHVCSLRITS